jgi:hypothetical protein
MTIRQCWAAAFLAALAFAPSPLVADTVKLGSAGGAEDNGREIANQVHILKNGSIVHSAAAVDIRDHSELFRRHMS